MQLSNKESGKINHTLSIQVGKAMSTRFESHTSQIQ